ncbi:hypothetical protein SAMN05216359_102490 [Roseateles sp. YR242]|nr:hypothetical protein SAMN05216359_102490 [Roseateles sp. YR242]
MRITPVATPPRRNAMDATASAPAPLGDERRSSSPSQPGTPPPLAGDGHVRQPTTRRTKSPLLETDRDDPKASDGNPMLVNTTDTRRAQEKAHAAENFRSMWSNVCSKAAELPKSIGDWLVQLVASINSR